VTEALDPRSHPVSFDIRARKPASSPVIPLAAPGRDRVLQRLERAEHRLDQLEAALATLAEVVPVDGTGEIFYVPSPGYSASPSASMSS
jgi:hypothetical protein